MYYFTITLKGQRQGLIPAREKLVASTLSCHYNTMSVATVVTDKSTIAETMKNKATLSLYYLLALEVSPATFALPSASRYILSLSSSMATKESPMLPGPADGPSAMGRGTGSSTSSLFKALSSSWNMINNVC